jgi:hypothetical protein
VKKSSLAAGLRAVAGSKAQAELVPIAPKGKGGSTVLVGAHFAPEVRRTLMLVQAEPDNMGKTLKQLLGEAINDLCVKYGKPQPYGGEQ